MKKCTISVLMVMLFLLSSMLAYSQVKLHELPEENVCLMKDYQAPVLKSVNSIFTEDFSSGTFPPAGWTIVGDGQDNWAEGTSNNAGGTPPEAYINWSPQFIGNSKLATSAIATSGYTSLLFEMKHYVSHYGSGYTLKVETTSDGGTTWNEVWSVTPEASIGPETLQFLITNDDVGSDNFQLAFTLDGDSYQINQWYFDDIVLSEALSFDAAVVAIDMPWLLATGTNLEPGATVQNMGSEIATFDVTFEILDGTSVIYSEVTTVTGLGAFETESVAFPTWVAIAGSYVVEVTADLSGDENTDNDMMSLDVEVVDGLVAKKPLYEEFTSSTCSPCVGANVIIAEVLGANPDEYTLIKYQMDWPGSGDPYYTEEGGVRKDYYGVSYVPDLYINSEQNDPYDFTQSVFDFYANNLTALEIDITEASIDEDLIITVSADLTPLANYAAGLTAHMVVVEKLTVGNVGSNGETEWHNVMMKMLPDAYGNTLDALSTGVQVSLSESYNMDLTNMETPNDLAVVVFVQDETDKSIVQSAVMDVDGTFASYEVDITIEDMDGNPLEGAEVMMEGNGTKTTDESGMVLYTGVFPGTYAIDVSAVGFFDGSGSVSVIDQNESVTIALEAPDFYWFEMFDVEPTDWTLHFSGWDYAYWYGGNMILFRQSGTTEPLMMVSPAIEIDPANMMYFDMGSASNDPNVSFGTVTDPTDPGTFTELMQIVPGAEWETYEFDVTTLTDSKTEVYFAWQITSSTQGFFSLDNVILTAGNTGSTTAFFDDFENGISNWEVTGSWGITDEQSYSPGNSLTDSPGGNYLPNQETYATMATGVDLSDPAILSAEVDWWMIMDIENGNFDYLYVEVSTDNFATYVQIASFFGEDLLDPWVEYNYPMGAFLGNDNVKVRFHFSSDGGYEVDGCYIDDFSIITSDVDNAPPEIFYEAPFAYEGSFDDFVAEAEILDASGVASAEVIYTVDGVAQPNVVGVDAGNDIWTFTIPQQDPGYQVDFVISATDASTGSNVMVTDTASYISGNYIVYDNAVVDFYTEIGPDGTQPTATGTAVVFTLEDPAQLVTALIRNYTDQSVTPPNNATMEVHVWSDGGTGPGEDLIDPIDVTIEANLVNTRAFTRVDLRPYAAQLSDIIGNVFVGYVVPDGVVRTTITQPGIANRSFLLNSGAWGSITDDYHFRLITGEEGENPTPAPENVTAMLEGLNDIAVDWDEPESGGQSPLEGYNLLRDGEEIAYVAIPETEYTDMGLEPATYEYCVTAVYEDGESFEVCADPVTVVPIPNPPAPTNLLTESILEDIILNWDAPGNEWMQWDSGENNGNGIGLTGGGTMVVSSHWDPISLVDYNGLTLTQIQFFPNGDPDATFTIKVWTGPTGMNEVLSQDVTSYNVDEWNIVDLDTPVAIDGTQDLWFGYEVVHGADQFPAGCDDGPAIAGFGDMIISGGSWVSLVSLAPTLDYNWNIAGYVEAMDGTTQLMGKPMNPSSAIGDFVAAGSTSITKKMNTAGNKSLVGYNIYHSLDNGAFSMIGSTTETTYTDLGAELILGDHCYEVTAVYDPEGESDPSNESCQLLSSVEEFLLNATAVYPNPASDVVNIKSDFDIEFIRVYNHAGQVVTDQLINNTMYQLNTSEFNSGLYLFQIETTEGSITKRIIIQ